MPLEKSASKPAISRNISEFHKGPSYAHTAEKFGKKDADRQAVAVAMNVARKAKRAKGGAVHVGPIIGDTGGRADKVNATVQDGTYVIPSQAVSHLGENNTMAGMKVLQRMFPLSAPKKDRRANGGIPVAIADGEFCVSPSDVKRIGKGDIDYGHRILDEWVMQLKDDHIKTLQGLEPPAQN
jgi:hypothetical protein